MMIELLEGGLALLLALVVHGAEIEGPIDEVIQSTTEGVAELKSMGVTIRYANDPNVTADDLAPDGRRKVIKTPVREITIAEFKETTPFPGRAPAQGFEGGTVIAEGHFEFEGGGRVFHADFLTVEPAENVVIGALMKRDTSLPFSVTNVQINGVDIEMLTDARMPSDEDHPDTAGATGKPKFKNQYGFPIKINSVISAVDWHDQANVPATAAEGYFIKDSKFYAFDFEYGGTGTLTFDPQTDPQASVERAEIRVETNNYRCNFRGHYAYERNLPPPTIDLQWTAEKAIGPAEVDFREAGYIRWRFTEDVNRLAEYPSKFEIVATVNGQVQEAQQESLEIARVDVDAD